MSSRVIRLPKIPSSGTPRTRLMDGRPQHTHEDRERAESFGAVAELYDRARPSYPEALIDALLAGGAERVLDVGCGTGIAGALLAARG